MVEYARIQHDLPVHYATDDFAKAKVEAADVSKDQEAAALAGVTVITDETSNQTGPAGRFVRRTICAELSDEFLAAFPNTEHRLAVLRDLFKGAIQVGSAASCRVEVDLSTNPCGLS